MRAYQRGFTLIELMVSITVLTIILGALYSINMGMIRAARTQDAQITMMEEGRKSLDHIVRNLRMTQTGALRTVDAALLPSPMGNGVVTNVRYQRPDDLDGNGTIIDVGMNLEMRPPRIFTVDTNDANANGRTITELVELNADGSYIRTLASNVSPPVAPGGGAGFYDAPLGGFTLQDTGNGIQITLIMRRLSMAGGATIVARLDELVVPRN